MTYLRLFATYGTYDRYSPTTTWLQYQQDSEGTQAGAVSHLGIFQ
jgi:hypothetical protein